MTQTEVKNLANELMTTNRINSNFIERGWKFTFIKTKKTIGRCDYTKKEIQFSVHYLSLPKEQIVQTILHELAHVQAPNHGHDRIWKLWAIQLGAKPERCKRITDEETKEHLDSVSKYKAVCPICQTSFNLHRRPKKLGSCAKCYPARFNKDYRFQLIQNYQKFIFKNT